LGAQDCGFSVDELPERLGLDLRFHLLPEAQSDTQGNHCDHDHCCLEIAGCERNHCQDAEHSVERMFEGAPQYQRPARWFLGGKLVRAELLEAPLCLGPRQTLATGPKALEYVGLSGLGRLGKAVKQSRHLNASFGHFGAWILTYRRCVNNAALLIHT